jgi:two-component system phosphate regulon response regulator PhoB
MSRILVVEDELAIAELISINLRHAGFEVTIAGDAEQAQVAVDGILPSLVVLDWMLPGQSGHALARTWRGQPRTRELPIIMLTARAEEADKVAGLDAGADDYLIKPFRLAELLARVRAHLRRVAAMPADEHGDEPLRAGDVVVDRAGRRAWAGDEELELRPKEFELLALLAAHAGRAVTRERIMREVWHTDWLGSTKTLDNHVLTLRRKLGPDVITTLRGVGYRLELP